MDNKNFYIKQIEQMSIFNLKHNINNNCKYLFLKLTGDNFYFIQLPIFIKITKKQDFIQLTNIGGNKYQKLFIKFLNLFEELNFNNNENLKVSLSLKGAGYSAIISECKKFLILNVGLSKKVNVILPLKKINVTCEKNIITVQGTDKKFIGDFVSKIRNIKKPDAYKGKGFWLRNEIRPLKDIKKI